MTNDSYQQLSPAKRRRLVYWAVLRGLLTATVLVVLYYVLPYRSLNGDTGLRLLAGLAIFVGITVWQVRSITGSRYPALKAAEALGLVLPALPAGVRVDVLRAGTSVRSELQSRP